MLKSPCTTAEDEARRKQSCGPHARLRKVRLRSHQELNDGLYGQSPTAFCLDETLVRTVHIAQVSAGQSLQQERFREHLLHDGPARLRSKSVLTGTNGFHIVEDCQGEASFPVHAAHDEAGARIVLRTRTSMLCEAECLHEIRMVCMRLEPIKMQKSGVLRGPPISLLEEEALDRLDEASPIVDGGHGN